MLPQNTSLVIESSATPRGQLNWTDPIANSSERKTTAVAKYCGFERRTIFSTEGPKNLLRLFFASVFFFFSEVIFHSKATRQTLPSLVTHAIAITNR